MNNLIRVIERNEDEAYGFYSLFTNRAYFFPLISLEENDIFITYKLEQVWNSFIKYEFEFVSDVTSISETLLYISSLLPSDTSMGCGYTIWQSYKLTNKTYWLPYIAYSYIEPEDSLIDIDSTRTNISPTYVKNSKEIAIWGAIGSIPKSLL